MNNNKNKIKKSKLKYLFPNKYTLIITTTSN